MKYLCIQALVQGNFFISILRCNIKIGIRIKRLISITEINSVNQWGAVWHIPYISLVVNGCADSYAT